ncbi:MAG TPA: hypothetical protein VFG01_07335 [Acidobacteriota bacterium]|nr:hypothetical protein [Acidobacteriota bacterium]
MSTSPIAEANTICDLARRFTYRGIPSIADAENLACSIIWVNG